MVYRAAACALCRVQSAGPAVRAVRPSSEPQLTMDKKGNNGSTTAAAASPVHVMELVKQFDFLSIGLGGKIHCALTNRDLPLRVDAVQQHLNSKKLKKEREWYKADYSKYEPLIVAHKTNPKMLFCKLTGIELNRVPAQVEAHVNGKRFRNRKLEMEGLKQAQRQPASADGDESDGSADEDEDEDGMSVSGEESEEEEEEEEGGGGAAERSPRGGKANGNRAGAKKGTGKGGGKAKGAKGGRGSDAQDNGASADQEPKQQGGKKKGARNKPADKQSPKQAAKGGKKMRPASGTPVVSAKAEGASVAPPGTKETTSKTAKSPKSKGKSTGSGKLEAKEVSGAEPSTPTAAAKRKNKVAEESASSRKKKRKA